ncbi:MAG: PHP domain-containing protein [Candidatus Eisenbacteria bacterium]
MSEIYADLHLHSDFSDGVVAPPELLVRAGYAGLSVVALTDHDTLDGVEPILAAARDGGPEVVPGVELSCTEGEREIHILGYWIDPGHPGLCAELARMREKRVRRAETIIDRLRTYQIDLRIEDVLSLTKNGLVGRPHIADAMVRGGWAADAESVYRKYIGDGKPAAVPKRFLTPPEGIRLIRDAGGISAVAHPGVSRLEDLLPGLAGEGLVALEVWHPKHSSREVERFAALADRIGLLPTGGSDYHGFDQGATMLGHYGLTEERFARLGKAAGRRPG